MQRNDQIPALFFTISIFAHVVIDVCHWKSIYRIKKSQTKIVMLQEINSHHPEPEFWIHDMSVFREFALFGNCRTPVSLDLIQIHRFSSTLGNRKEYAFLLAAIVNGHVISIYGLGSAKKTNMGAVFCSLAANGLLWRYHTQIHPLLDCHFALLAKASAHSYFRWIKSFHFHLTGDENEAFLLFFFEDWYVVSCRNRPSSETLSNLTTPLTFDSRKV